MENLINELQRLYLLPGQQWHKQKLDPESGEAAYYAEGDLTPAILASSFKGAETVALNLVSDSGMVRGIVFDFDRASDWPKVAALYEHLQTDLNLPAPAISVSGRKGYGLWLSLAEPLPVGQVRAFLVGVKLRYLADIPEALLDLRPDVDKPSFAAQAVIKLPPCIHKATGKWSAFIDPSTGASFTDTPWLDAAPPLNEQAELLASLESIKAGDFLKALAIVQVKTFGGGETAAKYLPHLDKLEGDSLPACVAALVGKGVPEGIQYNTANLNLAAYCRSRGLTKGAAEQLASEMAENSSNHSTSKKTVAQKLKSFRSNQHTAPFACDYARNTPEWRHLFGGESVCSKCPANPGHSSYWPGSSVESDATQGGAGLLERTVATELLAYAWQRGEPLPQITRVWPSYEATLGGRAFALPFYRLASDALTTGATASGFFAGVDSWVSATKLGQSLELVKGAAETFLAFVTVGGISDTAGRAALARAIELEKRAQLVELADATLKQGPDVTANVLAMKLRNAADETLKADSAAGPLSGYRQDLFKALSRDSGGDTIPTPFPRLTNLLHGGFKGGRLYVLIAPPKAGKTTLTAVCMDHAAAAGFPVLYVGYEMSREQMTEYALARKCGINSYRIETRHLKEEEAERVAASLEGYLNREGKCLELWEAGLTTSVGDMAAWATRAKVQHPGKTPLIVVDYLQLARTGIKEIDNHQSETKRVSAVAVACKDLARQTGAAVIALSSVTKEAERMARTEGELDVTAARDSLAIIHAADGVLTLQTATIEVGEGKGDNRTITELDPWAYLAHDARQKKQEIEAVSIERALQKLDSTYPQKWNVGPDYGIRARLTLARHRGSTGDVALYYRRAYHDMEAVELPGLEAVDIDDTQAAQAIEVFRKYEGSPPALNPLKGENTPAPTKEAEALQTAPQVTHDCRYITHLDDARAAIGNLSGLVGLDFETTGLDPHLHQARILSLYDGHGPALVIDLFSIGGLHQLKAELMGLQAVAFNAVFDMGFLWKSGIQITADCPMLAYHVLTGQRLGLKVLAKSYLGLELDKTEQVSDWAADELTQDQINYAGLDAVAVLALFPKVMAEVVERGSEKAYNLVRNAQGAIVAAELAGMPFEAGKQAELISLLTEKRDTLAQKLAEAMPGVSPSSGKQLSDWLTLQLGGEGSEKWKAWPKTGKGQLKTGGDDLTRGLVYLQDSAAIAVKDCLLPFKDVEKKLTAFGSSLSDKINPVTGRIHADISLAGTVTGRMSCIKPNLQQIPRDKEFRALFAPLPGRSFVIADYGQIELRVAAEIVGEESLLEAFREGRDPHEQTAALILGKPVTEVVKAERQLAKAVNFGLLYGQGAKGLQAYAAGTYGVTITEDQARKHRAAWFDAYPAFKQWHSKSGLAAKKALEVRTPSGRVRRWASTEDFRETEAYNTPVQGGGAEAMLASLPRLMARIAGTSAAPVMVVHDELILECDTADTAQIMAALQESMTEGMLEVFPEASTVGLVEAKPASSWADK